MTGGLTTTGANIGRAITTGAGAMTIGVGAAMTGLPTTTGPVVTTRCETTTGAVVSGA